jgi:uncharacterized protein (DUF2384 family)
MRLEERIARMGQIRKAYKVWSKNPEEREHLEEPIRVWEDNIKISLKNIEFEGVNCLCWGRNRDPNILL